MTGDGHQSESNGAVLVLLWGPKGPRRSLGLYPSLVGRWVLLLTSNGHVSGSHSSTLVSGIWTIITIHSTEFAEWVHLKTPAVTQYMRASTSNRLDSLQSVYSSQTPGSGLGHSRCGCTEGRYWSGKCGFWCFCGANIGVRWVSGGPRGCTRRWLGAGCCCCFQRTC